MTKDEALKLALKFFETMQRYKGVRSNIFIKFEPTATGDYLNLREFDERAKPTITAIKQALEAPVQEPVFCEYCGGNDDADFGLPTDHCTDCARPQPTPPVQPASTQKPVGKWMGDCIEWTENPYKFKKGQPIYTSTAQPAPVQEPSGFFRHEDVCGDEVGPATPYYLIPFPPQRTWVGLSEKERNDIEDYCEMMIGKPAFDAIEAKLRSKNT
jgi:hypothetical protein